tara:strand:- start:6830 stop:7999 length:1170 start_codon:yes stop_codon:yes gene_type:complete
MGVINEFKSEKNVNIIFNAAEKMINDKYSSIDIDSDNIMSMIAGTINSICSDAILLNKVVKVMELNKISLSKVKEQLDNIINKKNELPVDEVKNKEEIDQDKYDSEQLLLKVLELEEKRSYVNSIIPSKQMQKTVQVQSIQQDQKIMNNTDINIKILEKIESLSKDKIEIKYKNIIINSYNRDWDTMPNRNKLSFSINIDMKRNIIKHFKLLLPKIIKSKTPYLTMNITDGKNSNKINYIIKNTSTSYDNNYNWDTWEPINEDILLLSEKKWQVFFTDFNNKDLEMGSDGINIIEVINGNNDNTFDIVIENGDKILYNNFNMELINNFDKILLKTSNSENIMVNIIKIEDNILTIYNENLEKKDLINAKLLNYKSQYSIIMSYYQKNIL